MEIADDYKKRISRYVSFEEINVKEEKYLKTSSLEIVKEKEAKRILSKITKDDFLVLMDERGDVKDSKSLARFIDLNAINGIKRIVFIIGGAYGTHETIFKEARLTLALSKMILPHDMAKIVLLEQIYRAFTIIKGEPYSH